MAVAATAAAAAVERKSVFRRALTALRYAVAGAVTVVVVMTAVYAFHVVARTDNLYIEVDSYISVDLNASKQLSLRLSVDNPSGRVRFYYTGIHCVLSVNNSNSNNVNNCTFDLPDMVVAPDSLLPIYTEVGLNCTSNDIQDHFLSDGSKALTGNLMLTGSLTVGVYSAYNKTSVRTTYCCMSVTVGNVTSGPSSDVYSTGCYTIHTIDSIAGVDLGDGGG